MGSGATREEPIHRRMLIAALAVLASLAGASGAGATTEVRTQQVQGLDVVVAVDDGTSAQIQTARVVDAGQPYLALQNPGGAVPAAGCQTVSATVVACAGSFDAVIAFGNGGNDTITLDLIEDEMSPLHGEAYGGDGEDTLQAPPDHRVGVQQPESYMEGEAGNDRMVGGDGSDELHGGDGNDTIEAWMGSDVVRGENGDDTVSAGTENPDTDVSDVLDGGPGFDTIPAAGGDYNRSANDVVSISLDGRANDGEPGEDDNVTGVEKLRVDAARVTLVGSGAAEDFLVLADTSTIRGLGGDDRLVAYDGNDAIEGGDGDDYLEGGFGNDVLNGGAGVDDFVGDRNEQDVFPVGNDRILARDGKSEQVDCGIGADTAQVDSSDVVAPSCESIDRGGSADACEAAKKKLKAAKAKLKKARKSGNAAKVKRAKQRLKKAKARKRKECS